MYVYILTFSHYVTYLVYYQYLKMNTKHGTVGPQSWIHKFINLLNFVFINPYLHIQSLYILSSPMYGYYLKNYIYIYIYIIIIYILIYTLIDALNISIIQCIHFVKSIIFGISSVLSYHTVFCLILVIYMYTDYS